MVHEINKDCHNQKVFTKLRELENETIFQSLFPIFSVCSYFNHLGPFSFPHYCFYFDFILDSESHYTDIDIKIFNKMLEC